MIYPSIAQYLIPSSTPYSLLTSCFPGDFRSLPSVSGRNLLSPLQSAYTNGWEFPVTTDEELNLLDTQLRRLKIEYEIFFNNPTKKPPTDIEWKVLTLLRKFSDGSRMSFSQRFRYNEMAQRYAIYSDLWRKKARIREEGYRRPQDALLSVQGVRAGEEAKPQAHPVYGVGHSAPASSNEAAFRVRCSDTACVRS